jgi:hypothetical protein
MGDVAVDVISSDPTVKNVAATAATPAVASQGRTRAPARTQLGSYQLAYSRMEICSLRATQAVLVPAL